MLLPVWDVPHLGVKLICATVQLTVLEKHAHVALPGMEAFGRRSPRFRAARELEGEVVIEGEIVVRHQNMLVLLVVVRMDVRHVGARAYLVRRQETKAHSERIEMER